MADLAALQRRFYDHVTGQLTAHAPGDAPADDLIASGSLAVYATMYAIRLGDALADDYPKLRTALGADVFTQVIEGYLRAHPPRSFTLRDTGLALAAWLRTSDVAPAWAADLAALERARVEVFDGPDAPALAQAEAIALGDALPDLVVRWVPSSVVVPLAWAVDDLWSAIEDEQPAFEPACAPRVVLVWRQALSVLHRTLDADEAALAAPIAAGARFADVCEQLGAVHGDAAGMRAAELLLRWLAADALAAPPDLHRDAG
jgi:hypothetical protein